MIRLQDLSPRSAYSIARLYDDLNAGPRAPFQVVCVVEWTPVPGEAWVHGMLAKGDANRVLLRDLVVALAERGVRYVFAWRDTARRLPRGEIMADGSTRITLADFLPPRQFTTEWAPL